MNRLALLASVAGSTLAAGVSHAAHLGYWNSADDFYVRVSYMVDFDQARASNLFNPPFVTGLPGNGSMYCVPTASADLMAYVDRHGYVNIPGIDGPGLEDWSDASDVMAYNIATSYIDDMGDDMGTSTQDGTNNNNNQIFNAVRGRLNPSLFDVTYYARTNTWSPKAGNIANYIRQGGIVQFCYGRWNISGLDDLGVRDTGHCVVMTKVDKRAFMNYDDNEYVINFADPGSGGSSLFTQSPFAYRVERVEDSNYFLPGPGVFRNMSRIMFADGDARHRLIDSALAIYPKSSWGVYPTPDSLSWVSGAFQGGSGGGLTTQTFQAPGTVLWTEMAPDRSFASVVVAPTAGGPSRLYHFDLATGRPTLIDEIADTDAALAHHRDRTLLIAADSLGTAPATLTRIEMDTDLPRGEPRIEATFALNMPSVSDIAFEDATDSAVVLGDRDNDGLSDNLDYVVWRDHHSTPQLSRRLAIPEPQTAVDPHYGWIELIQEFDPSGFARPADLLLSDPDKGIVTAFRVLTGGAPAVEEVVRLNLGGPIQGVSAGDGNAIFITRNGAVEEYVYDAVARRISRVDTQNASPFNGLPALGAVQVSRSRTNFIPELHSGPAWNNIDPADLPPATQTVGDCLADIAAPFEILDLSDINAFITSFVAQQPLADLNADGLFDLADIALFIQGFTAGCN